MADVERGDRWRIDELARRAGLPVGTVRLYLRDGLVPSGRRVGRSMTYGVSHLNRLIRIRQLKAANFTLTAIKRMIDEGQFVMLDRVFGTDRRPRTGQELAEEVGVEPDLVEHARGDRIPRRSGRPRCRRVRRRGGQRGAGHRPADRDGDADSRCSRWCCPSTCGTCRRSSRIWSARSPGRRDLDHELPPEVVASYAERTARRPRGLPLPVGRRRRLPPPPDDPAPGPPGDAGTAPTPIPVGV